MSLGLLFAIAVIVLAILDQEIEMKNVFYCVKEMALLFALISMVLLAAFGGTAILLSNL